MARAHKLIRPLDEDDHALGAPTAPVTLVVYSDYQCPFSAKANDLVEAIRLHWGSQIHYAQRHFPLAKHPHAQQAAEAAEAAAAQGRFWEMHALLFEHQNALEMRHLIEYAYELRLDAPRFLEDIEKERYRAIIEEHLRTGKASGVSQTPTFFINGRRYDGEMALRPLINALEDAGRHSPRTYADLEEHPFLES